MTITANARALAQAVLAGDDMAVAGLVDCVMEELDLGPGRELLAVWGRVAALVMDGGTREPADVTSVFEGRAGKEGLTLKEWLAVRAFDCADVFMAERAERLRDRAAKLAE